MRRLLIASALLALPACMPRPEPPIPPVSYVISAPVVDDHAAWFTATWRSCPTCDDVPYIVTCPRTGVADVADCVWTQASPEDE